jgi:very-short-patch-repair endonuclease
MNNIKSIIELARELRKNQTEAEKILWRQLRGRKLSGYKFLRQHPIVYNSSNEKLYFFIADFYCAEANLIVELDGKIHEYNKEYDEQRDLIIKGKGINMVRIKNEELVFLSEVLERIKDVLTSNPSI